MSDTRPESSKHDNDMMPNPDFLVRHSGQLSPDEGQDPPYYDLSTPLGEAPVHPIPDTVEEGLALRPTTKPNKWLKPLTIIAGAGALGAAVLLAARGGEESPSSTPTENESPTSVSDTSPDTTITTGTSEETIPSNPVATAERVTINGLELVIPNGETPQEIMDSLAFNRTQVSNFVDFNGREEQARLNEEFLVYVAYEPGDEYSTQQLAVWQNAQEYRQGDAFVEYDIGFTDIQVLQQTDDLLQVEATMTDGSAEPVRKQLTLRLGEISTPNGVVPAWLIKFETFA